MRGRTTAHENMLLSPSATGIEVGVTLVLRT